MRFAWWGGAARHAATLKALALFEQRHPGLKVKAEYMGFAGYLERLTTQIAGGSEPDVMQINWAWLAMFSKRGNGFANLEAYGKDLLLDQLSPGDVDTGRVEGKLNALQVSYTARVMLWNAHTFERARLLLPRTWDEVLASGPAFKTRLGDAYHPMDGELYDMILLSQTYIHQKYGMAYLEKKPGQPTRVAMPIEAAREWVATYRHPRGQPHRHLAAVARQPGWR
jgi:oligogalacturonide transport system substrate-binding protein